MINKTMENNKPIKELSIKERRELRRQDRVIENEIEAKMRRRTNIIHWLLGFVLIVLPVAAIIGLVGYNATRPPIPESEIISGKGLHWHPELVIFVKGVKQEMPANLGVGASFMAPVHTHEPDGVIHLEFNGLVQKKDIALNQFFKSWGKDMRSFGTNLKMTVNGKENTEYENYIMQDKDKIEIQYE